MSARASTAPPSSMLDRFVPHEELRRAERDGDERSEIPSLKRFTVFNTDQCENLPPELASAPLAVPEGPIMPHAGALIAATGANFRIGGDRAFYSPVHDSFRCRGRRRISSRSTGTGPPCTSSAIMPGSRLCRYLFLPSRTRWPPARLRRHSQRDSRKASSLSSGRYLPGLALRAVTRASAFSLSRRSA